MIIDLIRHTTPDVAKGVCYGQTDIALCPNFEDECPKVLVKLNSRYDLVVSSPLSRCISLAEKISADHLMIDKRLLELDFGSWEMRRWSEIDQQELKDWSEGYLNNSPPNGESLKIMNARVLDFWNWLLIQEYKKVALISHAGVLRLIHAMIFSIPLEKMFQLDLDFGSVIRVRYTREHNTFSVKHL